MFRRRNGWRRRAGLTKPPAHFRCVTNTRKKETGMNTRTFALIFGIVFLAVDVAGFVPQLVQPAEGGAMNMGGEDMGMLLGMFPVNKWGTMWSLCFSCCGG